MKLEDIKHNMKSYTDLYGRSLIGSSDIDKAETKEELALIIDDHYNHLESACNDAQNSLTRFKINLGLPY